MRILTRKVCGVYKVTNLINGMSYIGQSRDIYSRWQSHKKGREKDHNYYIHNAIAKYGIDNFSFEILKECPIDQLDYWEKRYIIQFNSLKPNGYNLESGGNAQKILANETKEKISHSKRVMFTTAIGDFIRGKVSAANSKPVNQYDLNGKYMQTFPSLKDAYIYLGIDKDSSHIVECINKKVRQAYGYLWEWAGRGKDDIAPMREKFPTPLRGERHPFYGKSMSQEQRNIISETNSKPVNQYTKDGQYIQTFSSATAAAFSVAGYRNANGHIIKCCMGKMKTAYGYKWRYSK